MILVAFLLLGLTFSGSRVLAREAPEALAGGRGAIKAHHLILLHNDRLTVDVKGVPLRDVLREIERQAGITVVLDAAINETLSLAFYDLPLDEGVRHILRNHNFLLLYTTPTTLTGIEILAMEARSEQGRPEVSQAAQAEEAGEQKLLEAPGEEKEIGALEPLLHALQDEDSSVRERAVEALAEIGKEQAHEPLLKTLREDPDQDVRASAAEAFAQVGQGSASAVAGLIEALQDKASWVRAKAVEALEEIGGESAIAPLARVLLEDDDAVIRGSAVHALGNLGGERVMEALYAAALGDEDLYVRETAAQRLLKH